ncbi:MAG: Holliday junction branch migration protein RuvA [Mycobacteriaceae bacterium]
MIASVRGEVLAVALDHAVLEVGGVGLAVLATPATLGTLRRGVEARLQTTLVVREDSLTLYGFADGEQRELFVLLQTVSGVGPRLAMAVLAVLEPDVLRTALAEGELAVLQRVPGIGKRGAERLVVELRDKVEAAPSGAPAAGSAVRDQVLDALVGLGFTAKQAEPATDAVLTAEPGLGTAAALRAALSSLGARR